jgi:small subunit ribosomal protein S6
MRRYESVVILNPDMGDDDIRNFTERYTQLVKTSGGEIIKVEDWGLKRLAYLVNKKDKGRYILFDYVGEPALIYEIERQFKISEDVMKFLSVKLEAAVDLEAFKTAPKGEAEAEAEAPAEAEATEGAAPEAGAEAAPEDTTEAQEAVPAEQPAGEESQAASETEEAPAAPVAEPEPVASEPTKEGELS